MTIADHDGNAVTQESATPRRQAVDLPRAYRLLNHGPVVLVSSAHGGRRNVMAASWSMPQVFSGLKGR